MDMEAIDKVIKVRRKAARMEKELAALQAQLREIPTWTRLSSTDPYLSQIRLEWDPSVRHASAVRRTVSHTKRNYPRCNNASLKRTKHAATTIMLFQKRSTLRLRKRYVISLRKSLRNLSQLLVASRSGGHIKI